MNLFEDIVLMLADFGVPVSAKGRNCKGLLDSYDEQILAGGGPAPHVGRMESLICRTGDLSLVVGDSLTISGKPYSVRERYALDDGMLTRYLCLKGAA